MSCDTWRPLLVQAAENSLDALNETERESLATHLTHCDECRTDFDDQRAVRQALNTRLDAVPPAGFAQRVASAVATESLLDRATASSSSSQANIEATWVDMLRWRTWSFRLAPLAAGLLLFGVVTARTTAQTDADELDVIGLSDLAESWAFGGSEIDTRPAFTVLGQGDVNGDVLLDAILSAEPDEPLAEGDVS